MCTKYFFIFAMISQSSLSNGSLVWQAPAKVNLTLRVLGKMDDGFHALDSLMVPLDLADTLTFEKSDGYELVCDSPGVPVDEMNLVTKAVRIFQERTGKPCDWKVTLVKRVPHGAGLGGGSSDAATTFLALNELEDAGVSEDDLASWSAEIGSDIPFFIYRKCCVIRGRGEVVKPIDLADYPGLLGAEILLLKPEFGVDTPDAFKRWAGAEPLSGVDYKPQRVPWGEMVNDLEVPVFEKHRFLAEVKVWLQEQSEVSVAMMSGSGSTMMAVLKKSEVAESAGSSEKWDEEVKLLLDRARMVLDPNLWGCKVTVCGA